MKDRRELKPEEKALWDKVARTTRPLDRDAAADKSIDSGASALSEPARDVGVAALAPVGRRRAAPPERPTPGPGRLDRRTEQRLRRGSLEVEARLDLHGMTQAAAHRALRRFLIMVQEKGLRLVLVITGKGGFAIDRERHDHEAAPRGVLRRQVPLWLSGSEFAPFVAGFHPAHLRHGGDGALYVQVRRLRP